MEHASCAPVRCTVEHVDRRSIGVWGRRASRVGVGCVAVASLLVALAAVVTPRGGVVVAAIVLGSLSVVLSVGGGVAAVVTATTPLSPAHVEVLTASAIAAARMVITDQASDYASGYRARDAFHAHFPKLGAKLDEWDSLVEAHNASEEAFRERVRVGVGRVQIASIAPIDAVELETGICDLILSRAYNDELDAPFTYLDCAPKALVPIRVRTGLSVEERRASEQTMIDIVQRLGRDAQQWPETIETAACRRGLEAFKDEQRKSLLENLELVQERSPEYASKCPTCSGSPG